MPEKNKYPNGLKNTLERLGMSQNKLAQAIDVDRQQINRYYHGEYQLTRDWAERFSEALGVTPESLIFSDEAPGLVRAPLISWVSASGLAAPDLPVLDLDYSRSVAAPDLDPKGDWFALEVKGSSMDRISPPGSIIFVNRRDRRLVANACYVIRDTETGEATYKRYRPAPDRWEPVTFDPEHDTLYPDLGNRPEVIGRVRLSMISM